MYKIIKKTINKYEFNSKLFSKKEIKKILRDETMEDNEEYFVIKTIKIQDKTKKQSKFK